MRGIVRPCRKHLGPELFDRWQAHLCGLCLTLRDVAGQAERVLTGYDVLLLSVLVEAQAGKVETTTAAPCPLRGFTTATVIASRSRAAHLAAAGALVSAAAGLTDKLEDGDLARPTRAPARRIARRLNASGSALAAAVGFDAGPVLRAPAAAAAAERETSSDLDALLAPTGEAVAALFAHTAVVANRPDNAPALGACGRAFGRLVHLLDAVQDRDHDRSAGRFNPLEATGTDERSAQELSARLVAEVQRTLPCVDMQDSSLVDVLLGRELTNAVGRVLPPLANKAVTVPTQRTAGPGLVGAGLALGALIANVVSIGGSWGGGRRRRRHRDPYDQGYGYQRVGPSCGQLCACNCCANLACNACCCGSQCGN